MAEKALIPISASLRAKAKNNPNSPVSVSMVIRDSVSGAARATLIEEVRQMASSFTKAGNLVNFRIQGNRIQDLPQPEGVQYDVPSRACTQVVMEMVNPETGETVRATDGCQVENLRERGFVPAQGRDPISDPVNGDPENGGGGGGGGENQQAGFSGTSIALFAAGAAVIGGIVVAGSS